MDATAIGVAEEKDDEQRIHEQDIFDGVVLFLAAITPRLFSSVLGADDAPFGAVMGKRGDAGAALDAAATGAGSSASGATTVAASASETPSRCGQGREGAGRGIPEGAQRCQQHRQKDMNPLIGFALAHAEQTSLDHLECVGFYVG